MSWLRKTLATFELPPPVHEQFSETLALMVTIVGMFAIRKLVQVCFGIDAFFSVLPIRYVFDATDLALVVRLVFRLLALRT